jgi:hypothetical protein
LEAELQAALLQLGLAEQRIEVLEMERVELMSRQLDQRIGLT